MLKYKSHVFNRCIDEIRLRPMIKLNNDFISRCFLFFTLKDCIKHKHIVILKQFKTTFVQLANPKNPIMGTKSDTLVELR